MQVMNREEMIKKLESNDITIDDDHDIVTNAGNKDKADSEAMHIAVAKVREKTTKTGKVFGVKDKEPSKRLTANQQVFVQNILNGMTKIDAYKDAYDTRTENDTAISVNANRLIKNPKISALLGSLTDTFKEKIVNDAVDTRRYVMEQLYSYAATPEKSDNTKLKALEMMGRAVGMFTDKVEQKVEQISTDQLKAELKSHLTLLDNVAPITMKRKKK
jgi:hypothetical protein